MRSSRIWAWSCLRRPGVVGGRDGGDVALERDLVFTEPPEVVGRVVEARSEAGVAEGAHEFAGDVAGEGGFHDAEIRCFSVEHGEAVVVFGGEDDVLHADQLGETRPLGGVELCGVEGFGELFDVALKVVVAGTDHGMADLEAELGIDSPVNEEAKAEVAEPLEALGLVARAGDRLDTLGGEEKS